MITESFLTEHSSDGSIQKQTENTSLNDSHVVTPNRFSCPEQGPACTSDTLATDDPHALSSTHRKFLSLIDPTTYKAINRFGQLCSFTLNLDWDSSDKQSALTEYDSESIPSSSKFSCDAFGHSSDVLSRTTENGEPEQTGSLYDSSSIDGSYGDVNRGSVEHQTTDDCSRITLADYLDSLNHGSTRKALKPIPQLAHVKKMSTIPNSASVVSDETENGPTADKLNHDTLTAPLSPLTNETNSESGINLPRPPSTSVDYLLKRRTFLLDRLAVRYTELLCLMNEELELTGHPPENYLQCINAYHEAQEAIRNLHPPTQDRDAKNSKPEIAEDASNNIDSRASISSRHRASNPGLPLPNALRGNRLQETGFLLSPKAFRKASLKVSPSVTSLLRGSRLSLNNEEDRDHCTDDGPIQKRPPLNQSMTNLRQRSKSSSKNTHLIADRTTVEDKRSWTKAKFARDIHTPRETVQEELPKCPRSKISLSMSELTSSSSTPSLRDFGNSGKPEGQRTSDPQDTGTMRRQSSQTSVYESEMKDLDEKDRSQAIAWIDMELSAVRNILEANQLCAKERCRTRESRKAYKLAARKNEETIARLERQKEALQSGMMTETEDSSVDSYATSTPDGSSRSVCSANPGSSQLTFDSIHSADDDKKPLSNGHVKTTISKHTGRASNCVCSIGRKKPPLQGMYDGLSRALGLHKPPSQDGDNSPGSHSRSVSPECPSAGKRIGDPVRCSRGKLPSPRSTPPPPEKQDERLNGADSNRNTLTNRTDTDLSSSVPQAASTPNRRHLVRPQCVGDPPLSGLAANSQYETSSDTGLGTSVAKSVNRDTDSDPGHWNNVSAGTKSVSSTELCEPSVRYVSPNPINHYWSAKPDANGCRVVRVPCQPRRSIPSSASAAALISVTQTSGQTAPNASVDSSENGLARIRRLILVFHL
ncbi:unnamed protein product [Calicophoron daubneyi]|uniref:Uncharacterized protein n=1 Tax=Calicophoron daubneyi TaxID=300641 RepID=A0AAV2T203_CALDB